MGRFIGVDLGGTKLEVAAMVDGELGEPAIAPTASAGADALIEQIVGAVRSAGLDEAGAVGVGTPSIVEFETGMIRASAHVPLVDVPLRSVLTERLGVPAFVDNDANAAALAEACDESGEIVTGNLVMLTVGTGIGGGLVLGGRLYRGATGAAAELGHTLIGADLGAALPVAAEFPQPGSLEALAAGRALDAMARRAAADEPGSSLGRRAAEGGSVDGHDVVEGAKAGDEDSVELLRLLGERLGVGIANAVNTFDPDVVTIGGGVSAAGELLLAPARAAAKRFMLPGVGTSTEIRLARWGPDAGVRGAALLARHELEHMTAAAAAKGGSG